MDENRLKLRMMLANGPASKNRKKKSKFHKSPIIVSSSPSELGDEALKQCKRCNKIGPERWFRDEMRQGWIIDICEDCQDILFHPNITTAVSSAVSSETATSFSVSFENASGLPSGPLSAGLLPAGTLFAASSSACPPSLGPSSTGPPSQSTGQPSVQPKVVGRGRKRTNSQTAVEASKGQSAAKRTRTESARKPSQKVRDNTADEEELMRINIAQNAKKEAKKGQKNSQNRARQQLDKLLSP